MNAKMASRLNKILINGKWIRNKDGKICCSNDECINIAVGRGLCGKCAGYIPKCIMCGKRASYGVVGGKRTHCYKDKLPSMIDLNSKKCVVCKMKIPSFGYLGKSATHCANHKLPDMIDVARKKCIVCKLTVPIYGFYGGKRTHCVKDKLPGMINLTKNKCIVCNKTANYGIIGNSPTHCAVHKSPDMNDLIHKMCEICSEIQAYFGFPGKSHTHCSKHKLPGMINLKVKRCIICNNETAHYGIIGGKPTHCAKDKLLDMVNLGSRKCVICTTTIPGFGFPGGTATHCAKDKLPGMIDLVNKMCIVCNSTIAYFGIPGNSPTHCSNDRIEGMIYNPKSKCKFVSCREIAIYGLNKAIHCEIHKEHGEFNLIERRCSSCGLLEIIGVDGLCGICNPTNYRRVHLAKQREVENFLLTNNYTFRPDRQIDNGVCGKERPDFLFDAGDHFVIIEVDEDQHKSRSCECEQTRMVNISQTLGMPVFFIRYNPDLYKDIVGTKSGQHESKTKRLQKLKEWLDYALIHNPSTFGDFIQVQYLFYDNYQATDRPYTLLKLDSQ